MDDAAIRQLCAMAKNYDRRVIAIDFSPSTDGKVSIIFRFT